MILGYYSPVLNGFKFYVAYGCSFDDSVKTLGKAVKYQPTPDHCCVGRTVVIDDGVVLVWVDNKLDSIKEIGKWGVESVRHHEGLHLALRASEWINSERAQDAEEPLAYLLSIYGLCWQIIDKLIAGKSRVTSWIGRTVENFHIEIYP